MRYGVEGIPCKSGSAVATDISTSHLPPKYDNGAKERQRGHLSGKLAGVCEILLGGLLSALCTESKVGAGSYQSEGLLVSRDSLCCVLAAGSTSLKNCFASFLPSFLPFAGSIMPSLSGSDLIPFI